MTNMNEDAYPTVASDRSRRRPSTYNRNCNSIAVRSFLESVLQKSEARALLVDYWMAMRIARWARGMRSNLSRTLHGASSGRRRLAWASSQQTYSWKLANLPNFPPQKLSPAKAA
jgi:hypothetical protein